MKIEDLTDTQYLLVSNERVMIIISESITDLSPLVLRIYYPLKMYSELLSS